MTELKPLSPDDFESLYPIIEREEPFMEGLSDEMVRMELLRRDGWTVWLDGTMVGAITLCDLMPMHNVKIHAVIDEQYHGKWCTLKILRQVFTYLFVDLGLRRVSSFAFPHKTTDAAIMLSKMGFKIEGNIECGGRTFSGECYDVVLYGMLRERCPWLWTDKKKILSWMRWRKESGVM